MSARYSRREFMKAAAAGAGATLAGDVFANRHPHPRPTSLPYLDRINGNHEQKGCCGVRFYDAFDPGKLVVLSEWSCDQGSPSREVQTGSSTHRNYYDGGQYAYLDTAPDNSFTNLEAWFRYYT